MYELKVLGSFAAAHSLRNFKGRCESLHGHNWQVEVVVSGARLAEADILMDFGDLKELLKRALDGLDHRHLNELAPFKEQNPSSENIARYIYEAIEPHLPPGVGLERVSAWESDNSRASYLGPAA